MNLALFPRRILPLSTKHLTLLLILALALLACSATPGQPQDEEQTMTISVAQEPLSLDPHNTTGVIDSEIMDYIGAALVAVDATGQLVPYLAERWEQSEDGLTWTFHLKSGITFQDGTPFTAQDYVYTFDRALKTGGATADFLGPVASYEAPNDTTLVITLHEPYFPFLWTLATPSYLMPLSRAEVERQGDAYGRHPMSVGPYRLKEWREGETIILERNPDFRWGPAYAPAEYALDHIEFRIIPDPADQLAALEAGEIDMLRLDPQHMRQAQPILENYDLYEYLTTGADPMGAFNVSQPPLDDERVRHALNLAVDREGLLQAMERGEGRPQCGPISASVIGYWPGVEEHGCDFDIDRAEALLAETGYERGEDGILERDGEPFHLSIIAPPPYKEQAEFLKGSFEALGMEVEVEISENLGERVFGGEYQLAILNVLWGEADILYLTYHSTDFLFPLTHGNDTALDALLEKSRSIQNPDERQEAVNQAQQYIVEHALMLPLYTPRRLVAVSETLKGLQIRPDGSLLYEGAYRESSE